MTLKAIPLSLLGLTTLFVLTLQPAIFSHPVIHLFPSPFPDSSVLPDQTLLCPLKPPCDVSPRSLLTLTPVPESPHSSLSHIPLQQFLTCSENLPPSTRPLSKWSLPLLHFPFTASSSAPVPHIPFREKVPHSFAWPYWAPNSRLMCNSFFGYRIPLSHPTPPTPSLTPPFFSWSSSSQHKHLPPTPYYVSLFFFPVPLCQSPWAIIPSSYLLLHPCTKV